MSEKKQTRKNQAARVKTEQRGKRSRIDRLSERQESEQRNESKVRARGEANIKVSERVSEKKLRERE